MNTHKIMIPLLLMCLLALALPLRALAAEPQKDFTLAEEAVLYDMNRSWQRGYAPGEVGKRLKFTMPVASQKAVGTVRAELIPADQTVSPFTVQNMAASVEQAEEGLWAVRFSLRLYTDRQNGDYPCTVRVTGTDAYGSALTADIPVIVPIRKGGENQEAPRLALEDVVSDLRIGEAGEIALTLRDPCATLAAEDITLTVSDPEGEVLPAGSDTLFVPTLYPGETAMLHIPVTVLPAGTVKPHSLLFTMHWTALGEEQEQTEHITVPVAQEIRLEQGGLRMASSAVAGDSLTATLPLMNMGKGDIVNATVTLTLPGVAERQSVLVGTIKPGETRDAQLTVAVPTGAQGSFSGTVTAQAEDNGGNPTELSLPVTLTVEAPVLTASLETGGAPAETETPAAVWWLTAACVLLTAALGVQGVLLRQKLHKLEEEKL